MAPPSHALASAGTSVPITTAPLPARVSRLLQGRLSRITATPDNRTYPQSLQDTTDNRTPYSHASTNPQSHRLNSHPRLAHRSSRLPHRSSRLLYRHSRASGNPRPPVATEGPPGSDATPTRSAYTRNSHPLAIPTTLRQPPPHTTRYPTTPPIPCIHPSRLQPRRVAHHRRPPVCILPPRHRTRPSPTNTGTGVSRQRHSRAPPPPVHSRQWQSTPTPHGGEGPGVRPVPSRWAEGWDHRGAGA